MQFFFTNTPLKICECTKMWFNKLRLIAPPAIPFSVVINSVVCVIVLVYSPNNSEISVGGVKLSDVLCFRYMSITAKNRHDESWMIDLKENG